MLEDSGPVGATFEHDGKTYRIKPNFLCGALLRLVKSKKQQLIRDQAKLMMTEDPLHRGDIARAALSENLSAVELIAAMNDMEMIPTILQFACDIKSEEAEKIVNEYHDLVDLSFVLIGALGLQTLKNFARLQTMTNEDDLQEKS